MRILHKLFAKRYVYGSLLFLSLLAIIIIACYTADEALLPPDSPAASNKTVDRELPSVAGRKTAMLTQWEEEASARIINRPIKMSQQRQRLTREYAMIHYGEPMETIVPQAVVIHWTAMDGLDTVYRYFYNEEGPDYTEAEYGFLNAASHFLVDRDGAIYQLTPDTMLNRHAIGLNWCSIGIENVGGVDGLEDLTDAQLQANLFLVNYLRNKYPTVHYVFGHYQQYQAAEAGLWREQIADYRAEKVDPGPVFMKKIIAGLQNSGLVTFSP